MTDEENKLLKELTDSRISLNNLFKKTMYFVLLLLILQMLCSWVSITTIEISHDRTDVEQTRLYFETDYDYGTITQSQEMKVGDIE